MDGTRSCKYAYDIVSGKQLGSHIYAEFNQYSSVNFPTKTAFP